MSAARRVCSPKAAATYSMLMLHLQSLVPDPNVEGTSCGATRAHRERALLPLEVRNLGVWRRPSKRLLAWRLLRPSPYMETVLECANYLPELA